VTVNAEATGGTAGTGAAAGGATSTLEVESSGAATAVGSSKSGAVAGAGSGPAQATIQATTTNPEAAGVATAKSYATGASATATARSFGVGQARAISEATSDGAAGRGTAESTSVNGSSTVLSRAVSGTARPAVSRSETTFAPSRSFQLPDLGNGADRSLNAFVFANGAPGSAGVAQVNSHAQVAGLLGDSYNLFGLGWVGANHAGAVRRTHTVSTDHRFTHDAAKTLVLGLLDVTGYDGRDKGFSLSFKVTSGSNTLYAASYTKFSEVLHAFHDQAFEIGTLAAGGNTVTVSYSLTTSASGVDISYLLATKP
jgi:hypothetical protein